MNAVWSALIISQVWVAAGAVSGGLWPNIAGIVWLLLAIALQLAENRHAKAD
jgi:hypothetical protein